MRPVLFVVAMVALGVVGTAVAQESVEKLAENASRHSFKVGDVECRPLNNDPSHRNLSDPHRYLNGTHEYDFRLKDKDAKGHKPMCFSQTDSVHWLWTNEHLRKTKFSLSVTPSAGCGDNAFNFREGGLNACVDEISGDRAPNSGKCSFDVVATPCNGTAVKADPHIEFLDDGAAVLLKKIEKAADKRMRDAKKRKKAKKS